MPIATVSLQALDDSLNRLAAESILASAGRDEGLIPAYSLLGEIADLCAVEPALAGPAADMQRALDRLLDAAQPFDEVTLARLRDFVAWVTPAVAAVKRGETPTAVSEGRTTPSAGAEPMADRPDEPRAATTDGSSGRLALPVADGSDAVDVLLELNLAENRELLTEFHAEAVDHLQQIEAALLVLDQAPEDQDALNGIFRSFHTIKGNAGFLNLVPVHTLAHEVESLLALARAHELRLTTAIISEVLVSRDTLQILIEQVAEALTRGRLPTEIVPVAKRIRSVRKLTVSTQAAVPVEAPAPPPAAVQMEQPEAKTNAPAHLAANTVRVTTAKLDTLMDVVGELVIVQSQLVASAGPEDATSPLHRNVAQLARIAKELQRTAMALRMVPIKPVFQKMERLARDLARDLGKNVHFEVSGEDVELDRTVGEEIGDPLVHMVRNALDHGLDTPAERRAAGKDEMGIVRLSAFHQGSNLVIELSDDGRGIDPDRIFAKAMEKGLVSATTVLSREETLALIFAPGFSTAEKITSVSGRGVGMDVVKRNIEKLRGKIEIVSEKGRGSTFRIRLPLTMAIIDGLIVRVGTDKFILPSTSVQMSLRPGRDAVSTVHGIGEVFSLRGRLLPLHRLHRQFGIPGDAQQPWDGIVVIVEHAGKVSALLVDEMVSKQEVVIKNLGAFLQGLPGVSGGAILGDGNIALILDPVSLLQAA